MVMFTMALLLFCFTISNVSTRIFVAIMSVLVATLIGWSIWTSWDFGQDDVWQKSLVVLRRTRGALFKRVKRLNPFDTRRATRVPQDDHITLTGQLQHIRGTLFERVNGFNPFHTRRVPLDDHITLASSGRAGEVRV
jgi:hypothetical protein